MYKEIVEIVDSKDNDQAVAFYLEHGSNLFLKRLLASPLTPFVSKKLWVELNEMLASSKPVEIYSEPILPVVSDSLYDEVSDSVDPSVHGQFQDKLNALHKKRKVNFIQLKKARQGIFDDSHSVRETAVFKVLEHGRVNKECWAEINFFNKHGYIPEVAYEGLEDMTPLELSALIERDKNYIRKFSKQIKDNASEWNKDKIKEKALKIEERRIRLLQVYNLLGNVED